VPLLRAHLAQAGIAGDAGGVDDDVDAAVAVFDLRERLPATFEIADVERCEVDRATEFGEFAVEGGDPFAACGQVECHHLTPGAGEVAADFGAQSADAAGDDGNAS